MMTEAQRNMLTAARDRALNLTQPLRDLTAALNAMADPLAPEDKRLREAATLANMAASNLSQMSLKLGLAIDAEDYPQGKQGA